MGQLTLLLGGARSGKSSLAVRLAERFADGGGSVSVIVTAEAMDDDMAIRIARHRAERPPWPTTEASVALVEAVSAVPDDHLVLLDCLTVWVGNLMHHDRGTGEAVVTRTVALVEALVARGGPAVVVSNEVGMGIHPETTLGRDYRDELGRVNQMLASVATTNLLLVAGRALRLADPMDLVGSA